MEEMEKDSRAHRDGLVNNGTISRNAEEKRWAVWVGRSISSGKVSNLRRLRNVDSHPCSLQCSDRNLVGAYFINCTQGFENGLSLSSQDRL